MKKTETPLSYLRYFALSALLGLLLIQSCQDPENESPTINIISPKAGARAVAGDTLAVELEVQDDEEVLSVTLSLLDRDLQPVETKSIAVNAAEKQVRTAFPISDPSLRDDEYVLLATAFDTEQSTKASVSISLNQADRKLSHYLIWSDNRVTTYNPFFSEVSTAQLQSSVQHIEVKHAEQAYVVLLENGLLQYRNLITNERIWSSNEFSENTKVSHFTSDRFSCYLLTTNGTLEKRDNLGRLRSTSNETAQPLLYTSDLVEELVTVGNGKITNFDKELNGSSSYTTSINPSFLYTDPKRFLYAYNTNDGDGSIYRARFPYIQFEQTPSIGMDIGSVSHIVATETKQYLLQDNAVLELASGELSTFAQLNATGQMLVIDEISQKLWVLMPNVLLDYSTNPPVEKLSGSSSLKGMALVYNY